jgi:hypothetical protein
MLSVEIYYGILPTGVAAVDVPASWQPGKIVKKRHVEAELILLALEMATQNIAFKGAAEPDPSLFQRKDDGSVNTMLLCQVLAPAYMHLMGSKEEQEEHEVQCEAKRIGLMKRMLLWKNTNYVSQAMLTRAQKDPVFGALFVGLIPQGANMQDWWRLHIVGAKGLEGIGLGRVLKEAWGFTWWKPTPAELQTVSVQQQLQHKFQITAAAVYDELDPSDAKRPGTGQGQRHLRGAGSAPFAPGAASTLAPPLTASTAATSGGLSGPRGALGSDGAGRAVWGSETGSSSAFGGVGGLQAASAAVGVAAGSAGGAASSSRAARPLTRQNALYSQQRSPPRQAAGKRGRTPQEEVEAAAHHLLQH